MFFYISVWLNIRALLEKQVRKAFKKICKLSTHPLREQVPKTKVINYNLRNKNSARTNDTERFKNTFINTLSYRYTLNMWKVTLRLLLFYFSSWNEKYVTIRYVVFVLWEIKTFVIIIIMQLLLSL